MCGIWAVLNKHSTGLNGLDVEHMKNMAILTSLRGDHSSGLFAIKDPKKLAKIIKVPADPFGIFHHTDYENIHKMLQEAEVVVGHGRYATKGKISTKNAHPFREGNITLVHNGTTDLVSSEKDVEVDSHVLCQNISKVGVEQALKDLGKNYSNAYAIMLHDSGTGKVYIARNHSRPLHYMETSFAFYIMSDEDHLALFKKKYQSSAGEIKQFEAEEIFSFDISKREFDQETVSVKKVYLPVQHTTTHRYIRYAGISDWEAESYEGWHKEHGVWVPKKEYAVSSSEWLPDYQKGHVVDFEVTKVDDTVQPSTMYVYAGVDFKLPQNKIVFYTNKLMPELVGRFGRAKIIGVHKYPEGTRFQVKYKEIVWEPLDTGQNNLVTTCTEETFTKEFWEQACNVPCETCRGKLDVMTPEKCVVDEGPPIRTYCQDCVSGMLKEESATSRALGLT